MILKFWRHDYSETIEDADTFHVRSYNGPQDLEWAAEQYAQFYWDNRDGWESAWPVEFSVADEEDKFLGQVSVIMEQVPSFTGRQI